MRTHRLLALALSGAVLIGSGLAAAGPASANGCNPAEFPSGNGSSGSPFEIADGGDLAYVASYAGCFGYAFRQTADISLAGFSPWTPIGSTANAFAGTYDGGSFSISGLNVSLPTTDDVGLFGRLSAATITGVAIASGSVTGRDNVGALAGTAADSTIARSSSAASVTGRDIVGGLIGMMPNSANPGPAILRSSFASGTVTSSRNYSGGLIGMPIGAEISDVYATGSITGVWQVGGLIGENDASTLTNAYATGLVTAGSPTNAPGGVMGQQSSGAYAGVTWDTETTGQADPVFGAVVPITGRTTAQLHDIATFTDLGWSISAGWTGGATWAICAQGNGGYPFLTGFFTAQTAPCLASTSAQPDIVQQVGRVGADATCSAVAFPASGIPGLPNGGWGASWAQWMNDGTGGFVCNRTLFYDPALGRWAVRS